MTKIREKNREGENTHTHTYIYMMMMKWVEIITVKGDRFEDTSV